MKKKNDGLDLGIECMYCGNKRAVNSPLHKCRYTELLDWMVENCGVM